MSLYCRIENFSVQPDHFYVRIFRRIRFDWRAAGTAIFKFPSLALKPLQIGSVELEKKLDQI